MVWIKQLKVVGVLMVLTSVDVASTFTTTGFVIIILLIQIGGLGVMTLTISRTTN